MKKSSCESFDHSIGIEYNIYWMFTTQNQVDTVQSEGDNNFTIGITTFGLANHYIRVGLDVATDEIKKNGWRISGKCRHRCFRKNINHRKYDF